MKSYVWTAESLIGYTYSTSFLARHALGERSADFEADPRQRWQHTAGDGPYRQGIEYAYELARRPC